MSEYVRPFVEEMEQRVGDLEAVHVWLTAYIVSLEQDLNEFMEALWMEEELEPIEPSPLPSSMEDSWARNPAVGNDQQPDWKAIATATVQPPVDTAESVQADKDPVDSFVEVNEEQLDD